MGRDNGPIGPIFTCKDTNLCTPSTQTSTMRPYQKYLLLRALEELKQSNYDIAVELIQEILAMEPQKFT